MDMITNIEVKGFKSFRDVSIPLGPINVLIGANGSGKSNLVSLFRMIGYMLSGKLQEYIGLRGFADSLLYYGRKVTSNLSLDLSFSTKLGQSTYSAQWAATDQDKLIFTSEKWNVPVPLSLFPDHVVGGGEVLAAGGGYNETRLLSANGDPGPGAQFMSILLAKCKAYQFHDTSETANIRLSHYISNNRFLYGHGGNLAAYLHMIKATQSWYYNRIIETIRLMAPYFDDFVLEPEKLNPDYIKLNWREVGNDYLFGPHQLPDGLLRFMALTTVLGQPREDLPHTIIIDEPELGLHPAALNLLAAMVRSASHFCQIILATQSVSLVENFEPKDLVVVERQKVEGRNEFETVLKRIEEEKLAGWLEDYGIGELWEKNVLGGRP